MNFLDEEIGRHRKVQKNLNFRNKTRGENLTNSMSRHLGNNNASPSINPPHIYEPVRDKDKVKPLLSENHSEIANHPTEILINNIRQGYLKKTLQIYVQPQLTHDVSLKIIKTLVITTVRLTTDNLYQKRQIWFTYHIPPDSFHLIGSFALKLFLVISLPPSRLAQSHRIRYLATSTQHICFVS